MKRVLVLLALLASWIGFAGEAAYKALFVEETCLLVKADSAALDRFSEENKLEEKFSFLKAKFNLEGVDDQIQKEFEAKLKENKVLKVYLTAVVKKENILNKAKLEKGGFALFEMEKPVAPELVLELAGIMAKKEPFEYERTERGGFPAIQMKHKIGDVTVLLLDDGLSVVVCATADVDDYLARYRKGAGNVPAKLQEVLATADTGAQLSIALSMPDGFGKYLADKAEKARETDPMNATFMDTGSKVDGVSLSMNTQGKDLAMKIAFQMETPEDAIQLKAFIFEGVLKPMLSMMTDSEGKPYSFVQKLAFSCENRCAIVNTTITIDEITQLLRMF